jgi:acyl-CoA reductase-like NAD-dependent aldehyde dehydrogenase
MVGGLATTDAEGKGLFFEPTLLTNCTNDMAIVQTQINAPILCSIPLRGQSSFNEINENDFGTGVRIFSKD